MIRHLAVLLTFLGASFVARPASAGSWLFQPSYFSRGVPAETRQHIPQLNGRSAYRRPYVQLNPGGSVRGGYRINRIQIQSGNSLDTTYIRENFYQFQPRP